MDIIRLVDLLQHREEISDEENAELNEYLESVQNAGEKILDGKSREEVAAALATCQTIFQLVMMRDGNMMGLLLMQAGREVFDTLTMLVFRCALGISVLEEWR